MKTKGGYIPAIALMLHLSVTNILYVNGMFTVPCPVGCMEVRCTMGIGCPLGKCMPGWCAKLDGGRNVGTLCLPSCPAGEYCYRELGNFCTKCGVSNCEQCSNRFTCDSCERSYTLSSDKTKCTRRRGEF